MASAVGVFQDRRMPRVARVLMEGVPHHVTQRGNNRQDVFFSDPDRRLYLALLRAQSIRHGLQIQGYCLMTHHVHPIATPLRPDSLAKANGRTDYLYTQAIADRKRDRFAEEVRFPTCRR